jgi:hypothetical protein
MAGRAGPHGDPRRWQEGDRQRGGSGAPGRRWRGWRASREQGEAARGVGVDREEAGRAVHGGAERRQWSSRRRQCSIQERRRERMSRRKRGPQQLDSGLNR